MRVSDEMLGHIAFRWKVSAICATIKGNAQAWQSTELQQGGGREQSAHKMRFQSTYQASQVHLRYKYTLVKTIK
jgi:hypothetical protein